MSVAVGLLESSFQNTGSRIMLFAAGACTEGPGMVVGTALKEPIRSHNDVEKDVAKHMKKSVKVCLEIINIQFFDALARRAADKGHTIDIFAGCLDQVGLQEMKSLVNLTNGLMILSDSFATEVFKQSFLRVFSKDSQGNLNMAFNAVLEVQTSKELKVCGLIGPAVSAEKKGPSIGETEIGVSGTCAWKFCGISPKTTVAVYFEVANQV